MSEKNNLKNNYSIYRLSQKASDFCTTHKIKLPECHNYNRWYVLSNYLYEHRCVRDDKTIYTHQKEFELWRRIVARYSCDKSLLGIDKFMKWINNLYNFYFD